MKQPQAVSDLLSPPPRCLGMILVEAGRLDPLQAIRIMQLQQREGLRFGEAAQHLGILGDEDIRYALARQFEFDCLPPGDTSVSAKVPAAFGSRHPLVEGLRDLRSRVALHWMRRESSRNSLALVSARRGEGKSFVAANLAVLFAQLGRRTLLVDADLMHPTQHHLFKLDNRVGLSSVLGGLAGLEVAHPLPRLGALTLLTAGPMPPNPRELFYRPRLAGLLAHAGKAHEVVLVDTPSAALADARLIARQVETTVLVSRPNAATVAEVADLTTSLDNLLGAVVNQF